MQHDRKPTDEGLPPVPEQPDGVCGHCGCPYYLDIARRVGTKDWTRYCAPGCEEGTARVIVKENVRRG